MSPITTSAPTPALLAKMNPTTTASKSGDLTAAEASNRFMTLLVAQMKNQDPLSPMDNAAVTSQMAQLSTVTGIDKLNATLASLKTDMQSTSAVQATSMIGHGVLTAGSTMTLAGSAVSFGTNLVGAADNVKVVVHGENGSIVRTMELGSRDAGATTSEWDGKTDSGSMAPAGKYTFTVTAEQGGNAVAATPMTYGMVTSVSTGPSGTKLNLASHQSVDLSDVREII
jgi:flagellar basal-body rod modification protein FlgD